MPGELTDGDRASTQRSQPGRIVNQEHIRTAMALLLGPETEYALRIRASQRLARQGPPLLPLLLTTLNNYPEITSPPWPWWPPQYEHLSRLLLLLSQRAQIPLEALLQHPALSQPAGPVLWTSVIEAAGLLEQAGYESLFCRGLAEPWETVRYAAAMALANLAGKGSLLETTVDALRTHQSEEEPLSVRLASSYALLRNGESSGIEVLMTLLHPEAAEEARKAAAFVLATEPPAHLSSTCRERLIKLLLLLLPDSNSEIAMHAARALGSIALASILPPLCSLLESSDHCSQIAVLATLEQLASRNTIRQAIQRHTLPGQIAALLSADTPEVRRQASYTLAAIGGAYAAAVFGTTLLNSDHPGHIEAIEGLRLLHGVLRTPTRTNVVRWLLCTLRQQQEEAQITALDSLSYLLWQARVHGQKKARAAISTEILLDGTAIELLTNSSAWVRQRAVELLSILDNQPRTLRTRLMQLLRSDNDSGVRACIAYTLAQTPSRSDTPSPIPILITTLLDPDEHVAETALNTLGQLASPDDPIVVYVLKELAVCDNHLAKKLLKKWGK